MWTDAKPVKCMSEREIDVLRKCMIGNYLAPFKQAEIYKVRDCMIKELEESREKVDDIICKAGIDNSQTTGVRLATGASLTKDYYSNALNCFGRSRWVEKDDPAYWWVMPDNP